VKKDFDTKQRLKDCVAPPHKNQEFRKEVLDEKKSHVMASLNKRVNPYNPHDKPITYIKSKENHHRDCDKVTTFILPHSHSGKIGFGDLRSHNRTARAADQVSIRTPRLEKDILMEQQFSMPRDKLAKHVSGLTTTETDAAKIYCQYKKAFVTATSILNTNQDGLTSLTP